MSASRHRIAIVHPSLAVRGGAENVVLWLAHGLRERGYDILVVTAAFESTAWEPGEWDDIEVECLVAGRFDGLISHRGPARAMARRLRPLIADRDVVIAKNSPAIVWTTRAARKLGPAAPRIVYYCQEPCAQYHWRQTFPTLVAAAQAPDRYPACAEPFGRFLRTGRKLEAKKRVIIEKAEDLAAVEQADQVFANSAFTAKNAERVFERPVTPCLLGHPRPTLSGRSGPLSGRSGPLSGRSGPLSGRSGPNIGTRSPNATVASPDPYVAWITSMAPHKNALGFLEAVAISVHEFGLEDLRVRAVGLAGADFESHLAQKKITDQVQLETRLSESEIDDLIASSRFVAYPPVDEPFGLVPLHAMAHGRAVLASGIGGPAETVLHESTGLHMNPIDPREMASGLQRLWQDPSLCERLGIAGRERYAAEFTFDAFLDRFVHLGIERA